MSVKNLQQTATFKATPHAVYQTLVDPEQHEAFTGASAEFDPRVGGKFAHYDGSLVGFVLDLKPDRRIVLARRSTDWDEGAYSIAQFSLKKVRGGCRLEFSQYGIPASDYKDIADGWKTYYWGPMKTFLEE